MSALPDVLPVTAPRNSWGLPAGMTAGILLLLIAGFWPTLYSMIEIWDRSETYTHGYLIFPISAWLIWRKRAELARIRPYPDLRGLSLLAAAGAAWLLADAGSVNVVAQYAVIAMLIAAVWALLGWTFVRAAFFPLMFLLFAVPVGEFLIQPLMGVTADFAVTLLQVTGIPVYREGTFFSIPSGDWSVVEACSGLRYLIASITLGSLYAYLTYRSWGRRFVFAVLSGIVPIFANGIRAYMIVMIGHLAGMKYAVGVDHLIYGWVFFGVVMLLLFWIGSFWREDDQPEPGIATPVTANSSRSYAKMALPVAIATLLIAGLWPAYAVWLNARSLPPMPALQIEVQGGWQPGEAFTTWVPHWVGADRTLRQSYMQAGQKVLLELNYYATQRQGAELINSQNYMVSQSKNEHWINIGEKQRTVDIAGQPRQARQAKLESRDGQGRLLVWQWNLIDRRPTVNDPVGKLLLAFDRVLLRRDDGLSVLIATPYEGKEIDAAAATLARFAAGMEPAIAHTLDQVDGP